MNIDEMDKFTLLRWSALIDAVNMIYDKSEGCGIDIDSINLKQNHLIRFIDEKTEKIKVV